jgi:hypothetical protein
VTSLAADLSVKGLVYVGTDQGVFITKDAGLTWNEAATSKKFTSVAVDPANGGVAYAGTSDDVVYQTKDKGATWTPVVTWTPPPSPGMGICGIQGVAALAVDPTNSLVVYAGTDVGGGTVMKSKDGGATWAPASLHVTDAVSCLAIDPSASQTVYCGVDVNLGTESVYKTVTGGE